MRYFTDFLKAHLHPRSAHQLEGLWHGVAEFGGFGDGAAYTATAGRLEDMAESIRCVGGCSGLVGSYKGGERWDAQLLLSLLFLSV